MPRRRILYAVAVLLTTLLILSCGDSRSTTATEGPVTITYWTFLSDQGDSPRERALAANIAQFEQENPGIRVRVETVPFPQINPRLIQDAATGRGPEVVRIYSLFLGLHANAGTLEPLNRFVQDWDPDAYLVPWDAPVYNGERLAIPHDARIPILMYRHDMLAERGLEVPRTWTELGQVAGALTTGNVVGFEVGMSKADQANDLAETFVALLWAAGGEFFHADGTAAFNSPAGVRAVETLRDLIFVHGGMTVESLEHTYNTIHEALRAGTLAMGSLGSHRVVTIREQAGFGDRFRTTPLPGFTPDAPAPAYIIFFGLGMGRHAQHKEEAWKFIEFMASKDAELRRAQAGEVPIGIDVYNDPWFAQDAGAQELLMWRDYMEAHGRPFHHPEHWEEFMLMLSDAMEEVILNRADVQQILDRTAQRYNSLL